MFERVKKLFGREEEKPKPAMLAPGNDGLAQLAAWEIANGAYYDPTPKKIPEGVHSLVGEHITGKYFAVIEGDETVPYQVEHLPDDGFQPEGYPDKTWWIKILLDGVPVWTPRQEK